MSSDHSLKSGGAGDKLSSPTGLSKININTTGDDHKSTLQSPQQGGSNNMSRLASEASFSSRRSLEKPSPGDACLPTNIPGIEAEETARLPNRSRYDTPAFGSLRHSRIHERNQINGWSACWFGYTDNGYE
jgi:hypothetical protein